MLHFNWKKKKKKKKKKKNGHELGFNLQSMPLLAEFCTQVFFSKGKL